MLLSAVNREYYKAFGYCFLILFLVLSLCRLTRVFFILFCFVWDEKEEKQNTINEFRFMGDVLKHRKRKREKKRDMKTIKKGFSFALAIIIISPGLTYCVLCWIHIYIFLKKNIHFLSGRIEIPSQHRKCSSTSSSCSIFMLFRRRLVEIVLS